MSMLILILQSLIFGIVVGLALPVTNAPIAFFSLIAVNAILVTLYGRFKDD